MKSKFRKFSIVLVAVFLLFGLGIFDNSVNIVNAQDAGGQELGNAGDNPEARGNLLDSIERQKEGLSNTGLPQTASTERPQKVLYDIIRSILGILALVFLILVITAGIMWMLSAGNEEKITKAKKIMQSAVIGVVIVLMSYAITALIFELILT